MDATAAGTPPHPSRYVRVLGLLESRKRPVIPS